MNRFALVLSLSLAACVKAPPDLGPDAAPIVIGQTRLLTSKVLGEQRRITVYLPPDYAELGKRFPVVYLIDGGAREDFHHVTGIVQTSIDNQTMAPVIVVGIENIRRAHDLTAPTHNPDDLARTSDVGGSAKFREFLKTELMPWVNQTFTTSGETAVMGESLAGLFIVETLLTEPALFNRYLAVSPSLWWDSQALANAAGPRVAEIPPSVERLFLSVADETDINPPVATLVEHLRAKAPATLTWRFDPQPQEHHHTVFHPEAVKGLRFLFPGTRAP